MHKPVLIVRQWYIVTSIILVLVAIISGTYALTLRKQESSAMGGTSSWMTATDTARGLSITYPPGMEVSYSHDYPPVRSNDFQAMVFTFPQDVLSGGTVQDGSVAILKLRGSCSVSLDGNDNVPVSSSMLVAGIPFELRKFADAGAGNFYETSEYSTEKGGWCYRVSLFTHIINPGAMYGTESTIQAKTKRNADIKSNLNDIFTKMVKSFNFIKLK